MKKSVIAAVLPVVVLMSGCQSTTKYVDSNDESVAVLGLSQRDFDKAANDALQDIIASPLLVHPEADKGGRYVLSIYNIINDTSQRIDTDQLVKKIRVGLLNSGKFLTTTAVNFPEVALPVQKNRHRILHIHKNVPGVLGKVNQYFSALRMNIHAQYLQTFNDVGYVVLDVDPDTEASTAIITKLRAMPETIRSRVLF